MGGLPLVHALLSTAIDDPFGVAQDDVRRFETNSLYKVEASYARCARAIADEARRLDVPARQVNRIEHARGRNDRGAMLVVVKNRDVHHLAQALFDVEALGRLNVLEIDSAKRRTKIFDRVDEFVWVFRRDLKVDGVYICEALEQHRLSFHHRLRGQSSKIAETKNRGSVGYHSDHVAARRVVVDGRRIREDRL